MGTEQGEDKWLTCADCAQEFSFSIGEQGFYADRNLSEPKRCKPCREAKKSQRPQYAGE
jgi:hypothetical protein